MTDIFLHIEWLDPKAPATTIRGTKQQIYLRACQVIEQLIMDGDECQLIKVTKKPEPK